MNRVILIVGSGYSGSTLLAFLLNAHPDMVSIGELSGPTAAIEGSRTYMCSCGEPVVQCPFWLAVANSMEQRGLPLDLTRWESRFEVGTGLTRFALTRSLRSNTADRIRDRLVSATPGPGGVLRHRVRRNVALVQSICEVSGSSIFIDASKDPRRWTYLRKAPELDVRVLHLVRDIPGQAASSRKNAGHPIEDAARYWTRLQSQVSRLQRRVPPDRFLRVLYENLCTETSRELDRIASFVDAAPFEGPVHFRDHPHHIVGNRMRLASSDEVVLDEAWRDRLTEGEVDELLRRTRRTRAAVGYSSEPHKPN